jgi:uncharacterized Zn-binding protein involved in type VI secretion
MRRYDIFEGDTTTNGGTVQRGNPHDTLNGRAQAYERHPVWCPACKTMGKIGCIGARLSMKGPDGRDAALSDDVCLCQCSPSPRLVPSQTTSYVDV